MVLWIHTCKFLERPVSIGEASLNFLFSLMRKRSKTPKKPMSFGSKNCQDSDCCITENKTSSFRICSMAMIHKGPINCSAGNYYSMKMPGRTSFILAVRKTPSFVPFKQCQNPGNCAKPSPITTTTTFGLPSNNLKWCLIPLHRPLDHNMALLNCQAPARS